MKSNRQIIALIIAIGMSLPFFASCSNLVTSGESTSSDVNTTETENDVFAEKTTQKEDIEISQIIGLDNFGDLMEIFLFLKMAKALLFLGLGAIITKRIV